MEDSSDFEMQGYEHGVSFTIRGSIWPEDAWEKLLSRNKRAREMAASDGWSASGFIHYTPEVTGVSFLTKNVAKGRQGTWEIVFRTPDGKSYPSVSGAVHDIRSAVVGRSVSNLHESLRLASENAILQVLTTRGSGTRKSLGLRRDEMSRKLLPTFKLSPGRYSFLFERT